MKKNIFTTIFLFGIVLFSYGTVDNNSNSKSEINLNQEVNSNDVYPAVASTQLGPNMQNYSVGIEIHCSYGRNISKVTCDGRQVSYYPDYNQSNTYYFSKGMYTYYFKW